MASKQKSVLILCPSFFGYENRIAEAFRDEGFEVSLYDERPNTGLICKTALRYNLKFYKPVIRNYIKEIIELNKDKQFAYILVVKGEAIAEKEMAMLHAAYPEAKTILYFWDSVANTCDGEKKITLYDRVLTFDQNDAAKYNLTFLPLPYGKEYIRADESAEIEYDVAFIGTAHSARPRIVKQIKEQCDKMGRKCFIYFYSPHILVFLLNKLFNKDFRYISFKEVNFKSFSTEEVCSIYNVSRCVLDIEHPKQQGTTTRPIEMLPMKKKIITTNPYVKNFDFYNQNNFFIIDRDAPQIDESFIESEYLPIKKEILSQYSPKRFVEELLEI